MATQTAAVQIATGAPSAAAQATSTAGGATMATWTPVVMFPTVQPSAVVELQRFTYSYYYPNALAEGEVVNGVCKVLSPDGGCLTVNCWSYDPVQQTCVSQTASGEDWFPWLERGVACPPEYPFFTRFQVVDPAELRGTWVCVDRGPAIQSARLDFLQRIPSAKWGDVILAEVIMP